MRETKQPVRRFEASDESFVRRGAAAGNNGAVYTAPSPTCLTQPESLMLKATGIAAVLAVAALAAVAASNPAPAVSTNGVLATPAGPTLYTFDKDTAGSGKSACNAQCAANWPPLAAQAADAPS